MKTLLLESLGVGPRMSRAVIHGNTVYTAGQVADDISADVTEQTRQVISKLETLLLEAGTDKTNILSATIWLSDINTFAEMNAVWDAWVPSEMPPARACVEAKLVAPGYKVEIALIAAK